MRWTAVKEKVYRRGYTLRDVARMGGFEESHLRKVLALTRYNPEIQDYVAALVGETGEDLFGEFYWRRRAS